MTTATELRGRDLAYAVLDQIRDYPEAWNQANWESCFAGWVCRLRGYTVDGSVIIDQEGKATDHVDILAAKLLDLPGALSPQAMDLFYAENTRGDLRYFVKRYFRSFV